MNGLWTARVVSGLTGPLLALALASMGSAQTPLTPGGTDSEERRAHAKQRFEQGVAEYDAGRYEQALASFQEAYRLRPHPLVNVNIANCYDKLGKSLLAIFHFERFLESKSGSAAQQAEVNAALVRLRKQVGQLILRVTPDGALVILDQGEQRRAPILEPIQLDAGQHSLEVRLEGYQTVQRTVIVNGGGSFELNVALERADSAAPPVLAVTPSVAPPPAAVAPPAPLPPPVATPEPPPETERAPAAEPAPRRRAPIAAIVVGAASAAVLTAAALTGLAALDADKDFDDQRARLAMTDRPLDRVAIYDAAADAHDRAKSLAVLTDVLFGVGVAGAAVATILFVTHGSGEQQPRAGLELRLGPGAARVSGSF